MQTTTDIDTRLDEQVSELQSLIDQLEEERRLVVGQIGQLQSMLDRLVAVQASLRSTRVVH